MQKYIFIYTVSNLLLTASAFALSSLLTVDISSTLNVALAVGASFIAAWWFTNDHTCMPTQKEVALYARLAVIISWCMSIILMFILLPTPELDAIKALMSQLGFVIIAIISVLVSWLYYATLKWSFSWYAKQSIQNSHTN